MVIKVTMVMLDNFADIKLGIYADLKQPFSLKRVGFLLDKDHLK